MARLYLAAELCHGNTFAVLAGLLCTVDSNDAAAEVAVRDVRPAGITEPLSQVVLVRPGTNGLGEVHVASGLEETLVAIAGSARIRYSV